MSDMLIGIVGGVAATVIGAILVDIVRDHWSDRVAIRRIRRVGEEPVEALLELYERNFADRNNYDLDEIRQCMNMTFSPPRPVPVENITLVALFHREVVGFIMCHYYPSRRRGIVSYLAAEHPNASVQKRAGVKLVRSLRRILLRNNCELLFYEVEQPIERKKAGAKGPRHGVSALLRQRVEVTGLVAHELRFEYHCPLVSLRAAEESKKRFSLFCVSVRESLPRQIPRETVQEYLRFLYLDCYGDLYAPNDPAFAAHQQVLAAALAEVSRALPDFIPLE